MLYQNARRHKTVMFMRTSHLTRCGKFLFMITSSTKYPNKGVCHVKSQYVICVQFGKHTFTQASVDHYGLSYVMADTNLGAWCLVSGFRQAGRGDNMQQ